MTCMQARLALGGYVLGALEPRERQEVTQHLATCGSCRMELADYDELPGLLDQVPIDDVAAEVQLVELAQPPRAVSRVRRHPNLPVERPSPELLDRLLRRITGARGETVAPVKGAVRRRWRRGVAAAGIGALLVAVAFGAYALGVQGTHTGRRAPVPAAVLPQVFTLNDAASGVGLSAQLSGRSDGTAIMLHVWGIAPGQWCRLDAVGRDGTVQTVADWETYSRVDTQVSGYTAIDRAQLVGLRLARDNEREIAELTVK
ncbi:MAG TPA: zf-HC2 domain-containing protein [Frankiaceae bacterium]|jgi:hypothetical protein|nr:zf-HC2 domain-containing protein [Frankiaceae bacterium]